MAKVSAPTEPAVVGRAYFEAVATRDLDAMAAFYAPGAIGEIHGLVSLRVPDTYRAWFGALFAAFPDFEMEILDVVSDDEKVAMHWRATATFSGSGRFEGLEPNGARVDLRGCDVLRVRDGKIQHNDAYTNAADLARQLGALPAQGSLAERALSSALNLKTRATRALQRHRQHH